MRVGEGKLQGFGKGIDVGYRHHKAGVREAYRFKGDSERRIGGCGLRLLCGGVAGKEKERNEGEGNEVHTAILMVEKRQPHDRRLSFDAQSYYVVRWCSAK